MPSAWVRRVELDSGTVRFRVEYRLGGRESSVRYAGSFKIKREATARKNWVVGELAAVRVPDLRLLDPGPSLPTLQDAAAHWRESRIDVEEQTGKMHRSGSVRIFKVAPHLRGRRVDLITVDDVTTLVAALASNP